MSARSGAGISAAWANGRPALPRPGGRGLPRLALARVLPLKRGVLEEPHAHTASSRPRGMDRESPGPKVLFAERGQVPQRMQAGGCLPSTRVELRAPVPYRRRARTVVAPPAEDVHGCPAPTRDGRRRQPHPSRGGVGPPTAGRARAGDRGRARRAARPAADVAHLTPPPGPGQHGPGGGGRPRCAQSPSCNRGRA